MRSPGSRRWQRDVDGILLLDKPLGISSNTALQRVRALFGAKKAGHAGSLDPLASGLLPVCFGQATKVCGRLLNSGKSYLVTVQLGARTESLDCETEVIERVPVPQLDGTALDAALDSFLGAQTQVPPMHSALKHAGQRLYDMARRGESVERVPRQIVIGHIRRLGFADDRLEFEVGCSKGTYIRSLAADIAQRLGTLGYVAALRRLSVEPFAGLPMHDMRALEAMKAAGTLDRTLLASDRAFADLPEIRLPEQMEQGLLLGQSIKTQPQGASGQLRAYDARGRFLGLVEAAPDGRIRPLRLFIEVGGDQRSPAGQTW